VIDARQRAGTDRSLDLLAQRRRIGGHGPGRIRQGVIGGKAGRLRCGPPPAALSLSSAGAVLPVGGCSRRLSCYTRRYRQQYSHRVGLPSRCTAPRPGERASPASAAAGSLRRRSISLCVPNDGLAAAR
jgi:hypothetical protein